VTDNSGAKAADNVQVTVNATPAANKAPTVSAGGDQTIVQPSSAVTVSGTATDADGSIRSYKWVQVSGPSTIYFMNSTLASTDAKGLYAAGTYVFRLTATDNSGAASIDDMQVTVVAASQPLKVNAGSDQTIALPYVVAATVNGSATDGNGYITSYKWTQVSGPSTAYFMNSGAANTQVKGLSVAGSYVLRFTVTDSKGAVVSDDITVNATTSGTSARAVTTNASASALDTDNTAPTVNTITLWPNPVRDAFTLSLNNSYTGKLLIQVLDVAGAVRKSYATEKSQTATQTTVDISGLSAGTYFVRIQVGSWTETRKIVKI
jgi:hypothetical protein